VTTYVTRNGGARELESLCRLPISAPFGAKRNEVYDPVDANVLKMPSFSLVDLAKAVIQEIAPLYGTDPKDISIRHIGKRAGEKMCEG